MDQKEIFKCEECGKEGTVEEFRMDSLNFKHSAIYFLVCPDCNSTVAQSDVEENLSCI